MHGSHCIKTWAKLQSVVARSSAEAELYAACKAGSETLGSQAYMKELGWARGARLHIDSSSALSLIHKTGLGQAKHIEIQHLWLQGAVKSGRLTAEKVHTDLNPADLGTKHVEASTMWKLLGLLGYERRDGQSKLAKRAVV